MACAGVEGSTTLSPSPAASKVWGYGAKLRAWVSVCLSGHRSPHCYKFKQMASEQHL